MTKRKSRIDVNSVIRKSVIKEISLKITKVSKRKTIGVENSMIVKNPDGIID